ncbi:MAG: hypothetical protein ACYTAF_06700 [Planctomycetota bacterium]|jgi:hypothetical protein
MSKRERLVVIVTLCAAAAFLFNQFWLKPWERTWDQVSAELAEKRDSLGEKERMLAWEADVAADWARLKNALASEKRRDAAQVLLTHLNELERKAKVTMNFHRGREDEIGDFVEHSVEISLKTDINGLRNLLVEFENSKEFIKVSRVKVNANPFDRGRKDRLDVDLKISTIQYKPGKNGKKNGGRKS